MLVYVRKTLTIAAYVYFKELMCAVLSVVNLIKQNKKKIGEENGSNK